MQSIWLRSAKDKEVRKAEVMRYRVAFEELKEIL